MRVLLSSLLDRENWNQFSKERSDEEIQRVAGLPPSSPPTEGETKCAVCLGTKPILFLIDKTVRQLGIWQTTSVYEGYNHLFYCADCFQMAWQARFNRPQPIVLITVVGLEVEIPEMENMHLAPGESVNMGDLT